VGKWEIFHRLLAWVYVTGVHSQNPRLLPGLGVISYQKLVNVMCQLCCGPTVSQTTNVDSLDQIVTLLITFLNVMFLEVSRVMSVQQTVFVWYRLVNQLDFVRVQRARYLTQLVQKRLKVS
jgi:hypothetical protein